MKSLVRSEVLVEACLVALEKYVPSQNCLTLENTALPEWDDLFGAKENIVSVLAKLVSMQKTIAELKEREKGVDGDDEVKALTDHDWELLALCVERWQAARQIEASEG